MLTQTRPPGFNNSARQLNGPTRLNQAPRITTELAFVTVNHRATGLNCPEKAVPGRKVFAIKDSRCTLDEHALANAPLAAW